MVSKMERKKEEREKRKKKGTRYLNKFFHFLLHVALHLIFIDKLLEFGSHRIESGSILGLHVLSEIFVVESILDHVVQGAQQGNKKLW
jgi:hypothetical protein